MYAIIDIETTGGSYKYERITEIAVILHNGQQVTDRYSTLINPEILIPNNISRLTGITNEMVKSAPKFYEVAKKIVEMTADRVFVAHNAQFDYGFVREEFKQLGYPYRRKSLCTVKLARKVLPGLPSYSLGNLSQHLNIQNNARHRALGDAEATSVLLDYLLANDRENWTHKAVRKNDVLSDLHPHLQKEDIDALPHKVGVYYFKDDEGRLIYIGKSNNIHARIIAHLNNDQSAKAIEMKGKIAKIETYLTGNELIALLKESEEIKRYKPIYNRLLKKDGFEYGLFTSLTLEGFIQLEIQPIKYRTDAKMVFNTKQKGQSVLSYMEMHFGLCCNGMKQRKNQQCLTFAAGNCLGACEKAIDQADYNTQVEKALERLGFQETDVVYFGEGRSENELSIIIIKDKKYIGFGFIPKEKKDLKLEDLEPYLVSTAQNYDQHLIVKSFLNRSVKL